MAEELERSETQDPASDVRGEGWGWFLAELFGEFIPESVWVLAMVAVVIFLAAAFIAFFFDTFNGRPLQTLGLK